MRNNDGPPAGKYLIECSSGRAMCGVSPGDVPYQRPLFFLSGVVKIFSLSTRIDSPVPADPISFSPYFPRASSRWPPFYSRRDTADPILVSERRH